MYLPASHIPEARSSLIGPSPQPTTPIVHAPAPRNDLFTHAVQTLQASPNTKDHAKWHNVRHFIAYMLTLVALVVFAAPTFISIRLAYDNDVNYWIGRVGYLAIFVPIFIILIHFYHISMLRMRKLTRYFFLVTPVLPAVIFMIIGGTYMSHARFLYGELKAYDCSSTSSFSEKFRLQEAYNEARQAWNKCIARKEREIGGIPLRRLELPVLHACTEWPDLLDNETTTPWKGVAIPENAFRVRDPSNIPRFQYLADVEANHLCGGFCQPGPSLWISTRQSGRDGGPCAQFIAFGFLSVMHQGIIVFTMGAIVFALSFPLYFATKEYLANWGYMSATTFL